jgi:pimeloyl-ACP methyl ester carboxylesterase
VLFVHGGDPGVGPGGLLWSANLDAIAASGFHAVAVDRPGYGWSAALDDPDRHDVDFFVDHLEAFIDVVLGGEVHALVAQSRGALLAVLLLMRRSARIRRLVIANSNSVAPAYGATIGAVAAGDQDRGTVATLRRLVYDPDRLDTAWLAECERVGRREEIATTRAVHQHARDAYLEGLGNRKLAAMHWLQQESSDRDTLLVWGIGDYMTTFGDAASIFAMVDHDERRVQLSVLNRCGHFPFLEHPKHFNEVTARFLACPGRC